MADGCKLCFPRSRLLLTRNAVNHARAMRVAELMTDFRNLQRHLASIRVTHVPEDHNLEGYVVLRQCMSEGQAILNQPFQSSSVHPRGDEEQEKTQLRQYVRQALEDVGH